MNTTRRIEVLVLNLDERKDRWAGQQAVCGVQGVPHDLLGRLSAHDSLDYSAMNHVVDVMGHADPDFGEYADHYRDYEGWVTQTILAVQWTHLEAIKSIITSEKHVLVLEDDTFLNIPYAELCDIYFQILEVDRDLEVLTLDSNPMRPDYEAELVPVSLSRTESQVFSNFRYSSCRARVYSPSGALRMMDIMRTTGLVTEWIPMHLHEESQRNKKTMLFPDVSHYWLKDGAVDIGWKGYNFGNRSDIIARDVGVFGHVYDEKYLKGVELKKPRGQRKEVSLDETP